MLDRTIVPIYLVSFFLLVFAVPGFSVQAQPAFSFTYKAMLVPLDDPDQVQTGINWARSFGFNAVQFYDTSNTSIEEPGRIELLAGAIDHARALELQSAVQVRELSGIPPAYTVKGRIDFDNPDFWEFITTRYTSLLDQQIPAVDALILDFQGTDHSVFDDMEVLSANSPTDRAVKLIRAIHQVTSQYNKQLIVRTFPEDSQALDSLRLVFLKLSQYLEPHDLIVMSGEVASGSQPHFPHNPLTGQVAGFDQIIESDLSGENYGYNYFVSDQLDQLKYRLKFAKQQENVIGGAARLTPGTGPTLFNSPNEINPWAYTLLLDSVNTSTDSLRLQWIKNNYGDHPDAVHLQSAFARSFDIISAAFYTMGETYTEHSRIPGFGLASGCLAYKARSKWIPAFADVTDALFHPETQTLSDIQQEKDRALFLIDLSLQDLERAKTYLKGIEYRDFVRRFELLRNVTTAFKLHAAVFFGYYHFAHTGDGKKEILSGLQDIRAYADELERRCGTDCYMLDGRSISEDLRTFAGQVETLLKTPAVVHQTAGNAWGNIPVASIDTITVNGRPAFKLTTAPDNGRTASLFIDHRGELIEKREQLHLIDLPEKVYDAYRWVIRHEPPVRVEIIRTSRGARATYEIKAFSNHYSYHMRIADYGRILEEKAEPR